MKKLLLSAFLLSIMTANSQSKGASVFERIGSEMQHFVPDTTSVPEDKLTREIRKLREVKGGFNISEAILFKIGEDLSKSDITAEEAAKLEKFFSSGNGKTWLENAVIRIYREKFTYSEVRSMVRFYKSKAGQKMADESPVIMLKSLKAAESIVEDLKKSQPKP